MNIQEFIKAKEELAQEIQDYYFDRGARLTAQDWKWIKEKISQSLLEYNEKIKEMTIETAEQWFTINPKYRTKKRLLDDIITNLTQDTNPKE